MRHVDDNGVPKTDVAETASATTAEATMKTIVHGGMEVLMKPLDHSQLHLLVLYKFTGDR